MMNILDYVVNRIEERNVKDNKMYYDCEMREIMQEILLSGLEKYGFFNKNTFMGGTALMFFHGLNRYSKDLDFSINNRNNGFNWNDYKEGLIKHTKEIGLEITIEDEKTRDSDTFRVEVSTRSLNQMLDGKGIVPLEFTNKRNQKTARIKMEATIGVNTFEKETKILKMPKECSIEVYNINSLFSGKLNAILTRERLLEGKLVDENIGRDWYDLIWYINKGVEPKFKFLSDKLNDRGKYKGQNIKAETENIKIMLLERENGLNYEIINKDILNFTRKDNRVFLDKLLVNNNINNMGKDGYIIKSCLS